MDLSKCSWGRNAVLQVFTSLSTSRVYGWFVWGRVQRILATTFSRRRTFDAQCGLTAGLNCEAAHGAVWKLSDIGIYN